MISQLKYGTHKQWNITSVLGVQQRNDVQPIQDALLNKPGEKTV